MKEKGRHATWAEISACSHCSHLDHHENGQKGFYCMNPKSPYNPEESSQGVPLSDFEWLKGCEEIRYEGRKVGEGAFEYIPTDSILRSMVERVVKKYKSETEISEGFYTSEELAIIFSRARSKIKRDLEERTFEFEEINGDS